MPIRLKLLAEYVTQGGGLAMAGGYYSFQGVYGAARYHGTAVEEVLPVEISPNDDRVEVPEGFTPRVVAPTHPVTQGIPREWPALLGYNAVRIKPEATVLALVGEHSVDPWCNESPGPARENDVQAVIAERLKTLGAMVEQWEPDSGKLAKYEGYPGYYAGRDFHGRPNLAATLAGTGRGRSLLLFGHIDVVKAGAGWSTDPFGGARQDGHIYGRGTVDMEGGVAAMVMAVEAVVRAGVRPTGTILLGTVVDEEAGGMGTLAFVDRGYHADACILTEPTDLVVSPL